MELQVFKDKFMHTTYKLEEKLDKVRDVLLSEGEEDEPEESWAEYNWPQFSSTALEHIRALAKDAAKVYHFVVEDERPCDSDSEQLVYDSEMFRNLHDILDYVEDISRSFGHTYLKLTGEHLERAENPHNQDSIAGLADYIMEEFDLLVEDASEILSYLANNNCCESNPAPRKGTRK